MYLLSLQDVSDGAAEALWERAEGYLDEARLKKAEHTRQEKQKWESAGAGLLLQLAVREAVSGAQSTITEADEDRAFYRAAALENDPTEDAGKQGILLKHMVTRLTITELLERLEIYETPLHLEYTYGLQGKPYLKNYPFYFSLSHSEDYVLCILSQREVGADIQKILPRTNWRLVQRFFAPQEKECWENCASEEEQRDFFYRMWCRKEAYGKLTGEGIVSAVSVNLCDLCDTGDGIFCTPKDSPSKKYMMEEYTLQENYQLAVCRWI